jgi:hypothetical protein
MTNSILKYHQFEKHKLVSAGKENFTCSNAKDFFSNLITIMKYISTILTIIGEVESNY